MSNIMGVLYKRDRNCLHLMHTWVPSRFVVGFRLFISLVFFTLLCLFLSCVVCALCSHCLWFVVGFRLLISLVFFALLCLSLSCVVFVFVVCCVCLMFPLSLVCCWVQVFCVVWLSLSCVVCALYSHCLHCPFLIPPLFTLTFI